MLVKNRMSTQLLTVKEDTPVLEATELMRKNGVRRLPVVKGEKVVGIVTEDDVIRVFLQNLDHRFQKNGMRRDS